MIFILDINTCISVVIWNKDISNSNTGIFIVIKDISISNTDICIYSFRANPNKHFIVQNEQNVVKYGDKQEKIGLRPNIHMDCVKRIWYLSPMWAAKVQASLRIHAVSPEPPLLAHTSGIKVKRNLQTESQICGLSEWLGLRS